ncbi:MAG: N-6 DNA methylase [Prevotellaceae bacterium]|jgi:type I restriction-modification system DNA methylase subunit|nr:N-6 DNA methylase [Prevotellaceae bacterium]
MSEELLQRDLLKNPPKVGKWDFYNIGATTVKALKENNIIRSVDYGNIENKKPDALLVQKKNVIAVIEYKKPSEFNTKEKQEKAIKQELEVAQKLGAHIFIASDKQKSIWINPLTAKRIKDEDGKELTVNFDTANEKLPDLIEKIIVSIHKGNDQIKPKELVNPTDLAKRIWQIVWSISGATPESCLYSFVELFIFKYLSDLKVLDTPEDFDSVMKIYETQTPEYVINYYARNVRRKIKDELFPKGEDGTTIINGTVFVNNDNEAIEGRSIAFEKILREFQSYGRLDNIHPDFKSQLFESFLKESISKKNWGQFFTPLKVVQAIVKMAKDDIKDGYTIGDPACGVGKFLLEAVKPQLNDFYRVEKNQLKNNIEIFGYDIGFDKDEQKTIILAKANMLIYFSELIRDNKTMTKQFADLFNKSFELKKNSILGTLAVKEEEKYDLILSNPPYVTSGSSNIKEEIRRKGLSDYYKVNAMGLEGLFMEWIVKALKPNGKAFVVVPDGIFNRQNDKNIRQSILNECIIDAIISLPDKTFFSTSKKTYILCITKKSNKNRTQTEPVFTYLVSEIGESRDGYRFNIEQNDLREAVDWFNQFKNAKKTFKFNDKRCKIQPIEKFHAENYWNVERWWDKEELIELGIKEENKTIKFEELPQLLEDVANNILIYKEELLLLNEKKKSNVSFKQICINYLLDSPPTNSGLKKTDVSLIQTDEFQIPVYSASKDENLIFGFVSKDSKWKKYENLLTWNKDGSANYVFHRKNIFVPYEKVKLLKLKQKYSNDLLYEYMKIVIQESMMKEGFNFNNKCSMERVLKLFIPIPINKDGNFDLDKQNEIAEKYTYIAELNAKISEYKQQIEALNVEIETLSETQSLKISAIFNVEKGKSIYTNEFIVKNKGEYPLYSSQTTNNGIIGNINIFDYDCEAITWTTDGIYAGTVFLRNGKFSMTTHCGALIRKKENKKISLDYIYSYLKAKLKNHAVGQQNKRVTTGIIKNVEIPIPVNSKGDFDLSAQKEIAEKYRKIEQIKQSISEELDKISKVKIEFE